MYSIRQRVRYSEINQEKNLTLTGIINYFQDCSTFQSEDLGVGLEFWETNKRGWILSAWQAVVERYPKLGEQIEVCTWPTGFKGLYGTRNFVMKDENGKQIAYANSIWVFMDMKTGRPAKPSEDEIRAYQLEPELEMDYAPRKIELPKAFESLESFPVKKSQIDTNHHVNNSQYIQMALEVLPQEMTVKQVRVEYKKSAVYGDIVFPKVSIDETKTIVELCDADEKLYAAVEFIGEK